MYQEDKKVKNFGRIWVIFIIVCIVAGCEIWISALIVLIRSNAWRYGIAALWLVPFIPLCLAVTFAIRKIIIN